MRQPTTYSLGLKWKAIRGEISKHGFPLCICTISIFLSINTELQGFFSTVWKTEHGSVMDCNLMSFYIFISFCSEKASRKMKNTTSLCDTALNSLHISSFPYNEGNNEEIFSSSCYLCYMRNFNRTKKKNAFYFSFPLLQEKKFWTS